jgi:hypothetical protein
MDRFPVNSRAELEVSATLMRCAIARPRMEPSVGAPGGAQMYASSDRLDRKSHLRPDTPHLTARSDYRPSKSPTISIFSPEAPLIQSMFAMGLRVEYRKRPAYVRFLTGLRLQHPETVSPFGSRSNVQRSGFKVQGSRFKVHGSMYSGLRTLDFGLWTLDFRLPTTPRRHIVRLSHCGSVQLC